MTVKSLQVERAYSRADETADATSGAVSRVGKARERIQGWKCVSVTRLVSCLGWLQCVERAGGRGGEEGVEGVEGTWWRRKVERMNECGRMQVIGLNANTKLGWCNNRISVSISWKKNCMRRVRVIESWKRIFYKRKEERERENRKEMIGCGKMCKYLLVNII